MPVLTTPTYPTAGEPVTLTYTGQDGTTATWALTSVPPTSSLSTGLLMLPGAPNSPTPTNLAETGKGTDTFTPDVGGEYQVTGYDILQVFGRATFAGDAQGGARWTLVGSTSATIYVGDALELPIETTTGHGATLTLNVVNDTIRAATLESPLDERSRIASQTSATVAALAALVGLTSTAAAHDLSTDANDLRTKALAHFSNAGGVYHRNTSGTGTPDTADTITRYKSASSNAEAINLSNEMLDRLMGHLVSPTVTGVSRWHAFTDDTADDFVVKRASDAATCTVLLAYLRGIYTRHIARTTLNALEMHNAADVTNTVTTSTALESLVVQYLREIQNTTITTVSGVNVGAIRLGKLQGLRVRATQ